MGKRKKLLYIHNIYNVTMILNVNSWSAKNNKEVDIKQKYSVFVKKGSWERNQKKTTLVLRVSWSWNSQNQYL